MKALKLAGVASLEELDYEMPSLFVILEEYGRTMQAYATASAKQYKLTESALSNLMRVSRKTGIYFLLIDQSLNGWSPVVKANVKDYIAYHLGGNQGAAFNAYDLHKLRSNGQFWNNGEVYESWHTKAQADTLQRNLQGCKYKMLTDSQAIVDAEFRELDSTMESTSTKNRGVSSAQNRPIDTQKQSTSTLNNEAITLAESTSTPKNTSTVKPSLVGKPISAKDKALVKNVYALEGSINKTCTLLYGGLSPTRKAWITEVLRESEVLQ
jgi:hypothetical protein